MIGGSRCGRGRLCWSYGARNSSSGAGPSKYLSMALSNGCPHAPLGMIFGFSPLPISFLLLVGIIVMGYIISAFRPKMAKTILYRRVRS